MKFDPTDHCPDSIDLQILDLLQENCKQPLAAIGEKVGLTASSVMDRIHKLEQAGVITGYAASVDARRLGKDVCAFIGVSINHPQAISAFELEIGHIEDVLDCHHVTGNHTLLLKVKTENTESLERLIDRMRAIDGGTRTETMVVLSTHTERTRIGTQPADSGGLRRPRRPQGPRLRRAEGGS
jgi:Lrp/AsnC family leucine-responsive transcriptional regulator